MMALSGNTASEDSGEENWGTGGGKMELPVRERSACSAIWPAMGLDGRQHCLKAVRVGVTDGIEGRDL